MVLVRESHHQLLVFSAGQRIAQLTKRAKSQEIVLHPDQFRTVAPTAALRQATQPIGLQVVPPIVAHRPLSEYDRIFAVEVSQ